MYKIGEKEVQAVRRVLLSKKLFRYTIGHECERFERRYAKYVGVKYARLTSSGTTALTAALIGLKIGPGDEVIVPACTYMATAVSVLAVGAIPVIVDIDDTITIDPKAVEKAIGPHTRAIIPVHMWGLPCDMAALARIARRHKLLLIEDACQGVGGSYEGRPLGSLSHAAAFSFNFFKNLTCGEGGAFVTGDERVLKRGSCAVDCCNFYWMGRDPYTEHFTYSGSRATEVGGALLNVQLDRIRPMIRAMRSQKKRILRETAKSGLKPIRANSIDWECGTHVMHTLPTEEQADRFAKLTKGTVTGKTGRHVYTQWDPILDHKGGPSDALNPFLMKENKGLRMNYTKDMCPKSLDILNRTVMIGTNPNYTAAQIGAIIKNINAAAKKVL